MTAHRRRRGDGLLRSLWQNLVPLLALALAAYSVIGAEGNSDYARKVARDAADRVARVERADRDAQRLTAFRLCSRNRADRAFAHWATTAGRPASEARRIRRMWLEPLNRIPILGCEPNLRGRGARPLTPREQRRFVRRWTRGEVTLRELGVCPNSRFRQSTHPPGYCGPPPPPPPAPHRVKTP
jgi:hypothetical protein